LNLGLNCTIIPEQSVLPLSLKVSSITVFISSLYSKEVIKASSILFPALTVGVLFEPLVYKHASIAPHT
jgi:hypothetical protein